MGSQGFLAIAMGGGLRLGPSKGVNLPVSTGNQWWMSSLGNLFYGIVQNTLFNYKSTKIAQSSSCEFRKAL